MKKALRKIFWPVLSWFEKGEDSAGYRASHRRILLAVGFLFLILLGVSSYFGVVAQEAGALIPVAVFFCISAVCMIVGGLGSDRAVARIWGIK
jgi:hypothetical protein